MATRAEQIIQDAIKRTSNRYSGSGGDYGQTRQPMTGQEALETAKQAFDAYLSDQVDPVFADFKKIKEKTEILDGSRNRTALPKAAVRYDDLRYIKNFPSLPPNYRYVSGTPTAADFNAMYADIKKLYELLGSIAVIVGRNV